MTARATLLERRYRKSRSDEDHTAWVEQMRSMHALYWTTCITEARNPRKMWNSVLAVLRRCLTADILSKFFKDKIDAFRMETDKADPPTYSSYSGEEFSGFREYSMEEIRGVLIRSPAKTCSLDPIPTDVLLESIDILLPFICLMCNSSLSERCLPGSQKVAIIEFGSRWCQELSADFKLDITSGKKIVFKECVAVISRSLLHKIESD